MYVIGIVSTIKEGPFDVGNINFNETTETMQRNQETHAALTVFFKSLPFLRPSSPSSPPPPPPPAARV
jgi:hypothetical protein